MTDQQILSRLHNSDLSNYDNLSMLADFCIDLKDRLEPDEASIIENAKIVRDRASVYARRDYRFEDLYWKSLFLLAPFDFDSYLIYMERRREYKNKFYIPRRKQLRSLVSALQDLEERKIELLGISLPPGVGKTTLALFYLTWVAGRHPEKQSLTCSHNNDFLFGTYNEVYRIIDKHGEYLWNTVFPNVTVTYTNAKTMMIDIAIDKKHGKRFGTLEFTSIGSGNAGKVRASHLLYCDDLVSGIEEALNKTRLDQLWQKYTDDARQRKIGDCAELHIATRWSVHDPIGRLQRAFGDTGRAKFIVVPALNEKDESNFDYPIENGFTTKFYIDQRSIMDKMSWDALFMGKPIEREGLLYPEDSLRRYLSLPDKEPDAVIGVCDTKSKGTDYMFLPCFAQYGDDFYMIDCICDNSPDYDLQYRRIADIIIRNKMDSVDFESNSGGDRVAENVEKMIKGKARCGITMHYTTTNKETKIIVNAEWVKRHCLFKDKSMYAVQSDYGRAMDFLVSYTVAGKNAHDDVPDGLAQFVRFVGNMHGAKTTIIQSPF